jgi:calcium permeable stress-gated cation channel
LPLKKGQALTNNENGNHRRPPKDSGDQAVVLTLRKRYSVGPRRSGRRQSQDSRRDRGSTSAADVVRLEGPDGSPVDPTVINNPWEDARPGTRRTYHRHRAPPLRHRLSYDHASGVIMLPDDGDWLQQDGHDADDDESDDDEPNYEETTNGLETESTHNEESAVDTTTPSSPSQQLRPSRYGTYFHHPERAAARRRQSIPGAFPPS